MYSVNAVCVFSPAVRACMDVVGVEAVVEDGVAVGGHGVAVFDKFVLCI